MHIHKIDSSLTEHQNFLAQNRKDPITGDSISEGDEVVFCASCKSVFLKDTWEYLGNQHCEQTETLVNLPSNYEMIYLKTDANLLFYSYLRSDKRGTIDSIPVLNRSLWKYVGKQLAENDIFSSDIFYILMFVGVLAGIIATLIDENGMFIIISVLVIALLFGVLSSFNYKDTQKKITFQNNFSNNVFYISDKNIGFCTSYGTEEYVLEFGSIRFLSFTFTEFSDFSSLFSSYLSSSECVIEDSQKQRVRFHINYFEIYANDTFLKTLDFLHKTYGIEINIATNSIKNRDEIIKFIEKEESSLNFTFFD